MGSALQNPPQKLTAAEYSRLPEVAGFKDELIEGERLLSPLAKFRHGVVLDRLQTLLREQFPHMAVVRETGWRFQLPGGFDNVPGPDLMVVDRADYDRAALTDGYYHGQPSIVIEVISPSERKSRRLQKVGLYLEAGAGSVVELDYTKRCAIVHRPERDIPELLTSRIDWPFAADFAALFPFSEG